MDYDFIKELKIFVEADDSLNRLLKKALEKYYERKNGKVYSLSEHIRAIIYSLLSNNRPFKQIEDNETKIDEIFCNYDVEKIKEKIKNEGYIYFVNSLKEIKCGNINIKNQMEGLNDIILKLENISKEYGTIDNYYNNHQMKKKGYPYYLAKELADKNNEYKLKNMGPALVCEYFKNIGIDIAKPDTHIKRMMGNILGSDKEVTPKKAVEYVKEIAEKEEENKIPQIEVDQLIWLYCSDGYGEICTKVNPKCSKCVIKNYCKRV